MAPTELKQNSCWAPPVPVLILHPTPTIFSLQIGVFWQIYFRLNGAHSAMSVYFKQVVIVRTPFSDPRFSQNTDLQASMGPSKVANLRTTHCQRLTLTSEPGRAHLKIYIAN